MTIEDYIIKLQDIRNSLPAEVDKVLLKNSRFITGMLKLRLYNYGQDGNYDLIGFYAPKTIKLKKEKGQKADFITLRDTGSFYAGMFLKTEGNGDYEISSIDSKTPRLIAEYGPAILELTFKQQSDIIENIIEPEIQKLLDSLGDIDITL